MDKQQLTALVNETIEEMRFVPVINAESIAKAAMKRIPQGNLQFMIKAEIEALAAEILRKRFDPIARLADEALQGREPAKVLPFGAPRKGE